MRSGTVFLSARTTSSTGCSSNIIHDRGLLYLYSPGVLEACSPAVRRRLLQLVGPSSWNFTGIVILLILLIVAVMAVEVLIVLGVLFADELYSPDFCQIEVATTKERSANPKLIG